MTTTITVQSHNYPVRVELLDSGVVTHAETLWPEDGVRTYYVTTTRLLRAIDLEYEAADRNPHLPVTYSEKSRNG